MRIPQPPDLKFMADHTFEMNVPDYDSDALIKKNYIDELY